MKTMTVEDAMKEGINTRKVREIAKNELADGVVTRRRLEARISEAERKVKGF